jgi:hypothetical protein
MINSSIGIANTTIATAAKIISNKRLITCLYIKILISNQASQTSRRASFV